MAGKRGLDIDRRVGIAMSVLTSGQRGAVGRILQSPQRFAAHVANPANVKAIKGGDPQLYYSTIRHWAKNQRKTVNAVSRSPTRVYGRCKNVSLFR